MMKTQSSINSRTYDASTWRIADGPFEEEPNDFTLPQ